MKKLIVTSMLLGLLLSAASAFALPVTFDVAGLNDNTLRATVTADYVSTGLNTGYASFSILNTTATRGKITGFAFSLPGDGAGISSVSGTGSNSNFHLLNTPGGAWNTIDSPQLPGNFDAGMGTGPTFTGGGNPNLGILKGQLATFTLAFAGTGLSGLTTSGVLAALALEPSPYFAVRFQETGTCGQGSDVATPTPIPAAVWLLGSGLLGIMGFKRRRNAE